ncbi:hypothetical protein HIM_12533 [Hirsutella minnesotensis 3608]|uniref:Endonuclease/exonuclease/phosphatase domain-containing protein n=1 Tax=Hirsutella minnesotensis 3608 TaxID=1043627 RepID=A0A0F7ZVZ4_9HYPO|nr:hypothetical protein HIM_12533 [Hirsutella minnesotensis 3608]
MTPITSGQVIFLAGVAVVAYLWLLDKLAPSTSASRQGAEYGLRQEYPAAGEQSQAADGTTEIIFVHGLGADPTKTWRHGDVCWISQLFPQDLKEKGIQSSVRLFTFNYDSFWVRDANSTRLADTARSLGQQLTGDKALVDLPELQDRLKGVLFLGTPHHGSPFTRFGLLAARLNVGKIPSAHDTALVLADSERYDIVLLQEPWTGLKDGRCLTKTHPAYDAFSPANDWDDRDTRPRVMTYVRRSAGLVVDQKRPATTRDILWLTVNGITVVNFYRQPDYDGALEILLQWTATDKCLVAGDFNAKHPSWQTGRREGRGEDVAFWAIDNQLSLLNPSDVPTNARGNTIDLAFSNIPLADAVVEDHLATGSDHFTLSVTLPAPDPAPLPLGKVRLTSDDELERFVELVETGAAFIPVTTASPAELDDFASALVSLLECAARAAGRPVRKTTHGARWWNEECAKAAANYRAWRRVNPLGFDREVQLAKRGFHNMVRRAKRLYWRDLIDSFADSVFRAVRWLKPSGPFQAPPLQIDGRVYETQLEKATALRRATLERRTASDDIPDPWIPVNTDKMIPFPDQVSFEEACGATLRTGNTSPGSDNITVRMLRAVWHAIGSLVHRLYQGCLSIGYHPKPFRGAEVVMIAKPGRRDLSTPRAWRPISLLSCLGKGLERLIARRLAWPRSVSAYCSRNKPARFRRGRP